MTVTEVAIIGGGVIGMMTCHGIFIRLRPEPGVHLRLLARFEQSPGARTFIACSGPGDGAGLAA